MGPKSEADSKDHQKSLVTTKQISQPPTSDKNNPVEETKRLDVEISEEYPKSVFEQSESDGKHNSFEKMLLLNSERNNEDSKKNSDFKI